MENTFFWKGLNEINVSIENNIKDEIIKISNIKDHIYILTTKYNLYHGVIENINEQLQLHLIKSDIQATNIACSSQYLYLIDTNGSILKISEDLHEREEIIFKSDDEIKACKHIKIKHMNVNDYGCLFVTENGELWALGSMPELGIHAIHQPKRVTFFNEHFVHNAVIGHNFGAALVCKYTDYIQDDTISTECNSSSSENVFLQSTTSCPKCVSSSTCSSLISLQSSEHKTNEIHDVSTSSSSNPDKSIDSSIDDDIIHDESDSIQQINLPKLINFPENVDETEKNDENYIKSSIILRNTEAAKEFLTRQLSWMSDVGEEYLVECTEVLPARIIKQNVSNVANLVYESVKTVGDKVVTLSRHVSTASGGNGDGLHRSVHEKCDANLIPNNKKFRNNKTLKMIIKQGVILINTEVWTWGDIEYGQLGVGDIIKRNTPISITNLTNLGVKNLYCGQYHCTALTLDGCAYTWGRNNYHQVLIANNNNNNDHNYYSSPQQMLRTERVCNINCGDFHTLFLTNNSELYFIGKHLTGFTKQLFQLKYDFNQEDQQLKLFSSGMFTCLSCTNKDDENKEDMKLKQEQQYKKILKERLVNEQHFLESTNLVYTKIIKEFQSKTNSDIDVYHTLFECYTNILYFTASNILSIQEYLDNQITDLSEIIMIKNIDEHISIYKSYLKELCNIIVVNGIAHISKVIEQLSAAIYEQFTNILPSKKINKSLDIQLLLIFQYPLTRINNIYKSLLVQLQQVNNTNSTNNTNTNINYANLINKWNFLINEQEKLRKDADLTKYFWETTVSKNELILKYRLNERRIVLESQTMPIYFKDSGRFQNHWFILFNDLFIHVINNSIVHEYQLQTIWCESMLDTDQLKNAVKLIMPEETLLLYTLLPQYKYQWLTSIQSMIQLNLNKNNNKSLTRRTTSYVFKKHPIYKNAKYTGNWLNGQMHGYGTLQWSNNSDDQNSGKIYCGHFEKNQLNGYGRIDAPNIGIYEGQLKANLQNGHGIMHYINGDIYQGQFKDGLPHGHGILKHGNFMSNLSSASVYIGEWLCGTKHGYGVIDNISEGQKYLGHWSDNKKNDHGVIVTLDGIYYEGIFHQDHLMGHGIMIFEDGTHYEGEFKSTGILNGKGVLTLNNGDQIEGTFLNGSFNNTSNTSIKITNALLHIKKIDEEQIKLNNYKSFNKLSVQPNNKWKAIFKQLYDILQVTEDNIIDNTININKIWQNIAILITNFKQNYRFLNKCYHQYQSSVSDVNQLLIIDQLDTIPLFGRENLTKETFNQVRQYLQKAFDCIYHPLGILLMDITTAYTATYGGVIVHLLLLKHAVAELHSITDRIYQVIRLLFPALPPLGRELIFQDDDPENEVVSATAILHPILLPRVHSALFVLYTLHHKKEDDAYWKRLLKWNKQPDATLMAFLGIDQKFWLTKSSKHTTTVKNEESSPMYNEIYQDAIVNLQQLKTTFSPLEKLLVLRQTFQKMNSIVQVELGESYSWTMDELFPVFHFIVVRARILQLGSEIHFIEDFMEPYLQNGELGIMFTILKACYYQILQEKINI